MEPHKRSRPEAESADKPGSFKNFITRVVDKEIKRVLKAEEDFQIGRKHIERSRAK
jgi:hypothetical protein